jgi:putative NIF3 family GTP cyclohydrolase 1 type 2
MTRISRREFVALTAIGTGTVPFTLRQGPRNSTPAVTAQEIIDRIKKSVGVEWKSDTVDTFKAGDPAVVVKGIVTTAMATMDVLKQAVKAGANLVITYEPTFYAKADTPTADPVCAAKTGFINKNKLVVWRFSDHWRLRKPDPLAQGLIDVLGWSALRAAGDPTRFSIPSITLDALATRVKKTLTARGGIRVVGDRQTRVEKVALLPGGTPLQASLNTLPSVDVIIAGEVREWESVEYARDTVNAGGKKGLIVLGRVLSEEPGMNVCAQWLRTIVPELTTTWIRVGDPYWRRL